MTFTPGTRVRVLQPQWNDSIWGFTGTIQDPTGDRRNPTNRNRLALDHPNPRHTGRNDIPLNVVFVADTEIEPLIQGKTSHTGWSQP